MKLFTKAKAILTSVTLASLLLGSLVAAPAALADGTGQIEGGSAVYEAKNLTTGSAYSDNTSASACDELQYSIRLHNTGFVAVNNINVQVVLPTGASTTNTSTMTATYTDGLVSSTSDTTTVNFTNPQTISYESGTTKLYDSNGQLVQNEPDGITGSGVGLGSLNGSTTEYLNFQAKVNCPTPPPSATFSCDELDVTAADNRTVKISVFNTTATNGAVFKNAVVNWGDNSVPLTSANIVGQSHQYGANGTFTIAATAHFTVNGQDVTASGSQCQKSVTFSSAPPKVTPPPAAPTALVNTGPGDVAALFGGTTAAGTFGYRWMLTRRRK